MEMVLGPGGDTLDKNAGQLVIFKIGMIVVTMQKVRVLRRDRSAETALVFPEVLLRNGFKPPAGFAAEAKGEIIAEVDVLNGVEEVVFVRIGRAVEVAEVVVVTQQGVLGPRQRLARIGRPAGGGRFIVGFGRGFAGLGPGRGGSGP